MIYLLKRVRGNIHEGQNLEYYNRLPNLIINKMLELQPKKAKTFLQLIFNSY
jgi:hypothetical protein